MSKVIEKTFYYTESAYKGRKERYIKFDVDKTYTTDWYKDGKIAYDGVEDRMGNPIQFTKNNAEGAVIQKCENNVTTTYTDDGKMLKQREDLNTGLLEVYDNGILAKTVRTFKENGEELHEIILYSDNKPSSKQLLNKDGKDVEELRKQKRLEIQYDSLYNVLNNIISYNVSQNIQPTNFSTPQQPCRKALYESAEKLSLLEIAYYKHEKVLDKLAKKRTNYSSSKKDQKAVDDINMYINEIKQQNLIQRYDTLASVKKEIEQVGINLYNIECAYTYYQGQQGYKDNKPNKHKVAYNAYISVTQYLESRLTNESLSNMLGLLELYATVCSKMIKWENEKISSIEKLLKKTQNPEEQLMIFIKNDINQN